MAVYHTSFMFARIFANNVRDRKSATLSSKSTVAIWAYNGGQAVQLTVSDTQQTAAGWWKVTSTGPNLGKVEKSREKSGRFRCDGL